MAANDPFSQGVEAPSEDPFESQQDFQQGDDPFEEEHQVTQEPVEGRPIVDAEGNVVDPTTDQSRAATNGESQGSPEAAASPAAQAAAAPAAPPSPSPASATTETPEQAAEREAAEAAAAEAEGPARTPRAEVNEKGEVVKRPYRLLTPDGKGNWSEVAWWEDKDGNMVAKGTQGAKRQTQCLVHSKDAALRIGFRAMGSPPQGVKLVALADKWFAVKHVAPDVDPQPRVRLKIS